MIPIDMGALVYTSVCMPIHVALKSLAEMLMCNAVVAGEPGRQHADSHLDV
jgi:hypothetical protein